MTEPPLPYIPDPDEVARLLAVRTIDDTGAELGVWTDNTRPTAAQVADLYEFAAEDLAGRLGVLPAFELYDECQRAAALQAACLVLLSFYPEADGGGGSTQIGTFTAMYLQAASQLQDRVWRVPVRLP